MNKNNFIKNDIENSGVTGLVRIITKKAGTDEVLRTVEYKNKVMKGINTGVSIIAQRLGSLNTYTGNVTHGAIGTGNTAPADSDTALQTQTVQVGVSANQTIVNNVVTLQFFFTDAVLANGTYYEFGTKIDTTQLFNRVLFGSPYIKATGEDTTIEVIFTINNA